MARRSRRFERINNFLSQVRMEFIVVGGAEISVWWNVIFEILKAGGEES